MVRVQEEAIKRCRQQDRAAQKALFERLYAPAFRLCFRYLGNTQEAEDCLMRGMMKAFSKLDSFSYKNDESFYYWIRRILINECLMELRKKNSLLLVSADDSPGASVEAGVLERLSAEELYELVTELPEGYRTVFNLYVIEGYQHGEIAALLGISESTSRTQLAKAKNRLKRRIVQLNFSYGT